MKNKQALFLLLTANIISGFAQGISMLAIPWYFTTVTKQTTFYGWAYAVITIGTVFWSLYTGTLIDKYSRKKIFILINTSGAIILTSVAAFGYFHGELHAVPVALAFAATIFIYNIHYPALYAFGQEISEKKDYGRMNALFEIQGQATTILGGAAGSILLTGTENGKLNLMGWSTTLPFDIPKWELHEIFLMDGLSYIFAILLLLFIKYTAQQERIIHGGSILSRIRMGVEFLREHPLVFWFGNLSHSIFVILLVEIHLLLPLYVNNHLKAGADIYASSDIYYAIGALLAGVGIRNAFKNTSPVRAVIILMWTTVAGLLIVTFTKSLLLFFIFSFLIGVTNAGTRVLRITWLFNQIPNTYMGRAGSVFQVLNILLRSLFIGLFSIPFFAEGSNIIWTYFIGAIFIAVSVIPLMMKEKEMEMPVNPKL